MGIFDDLKKLFGKKTTETSPEEDRSELSLSEQIRRRNAEQSARITSIDDRKPPNPVPSVKDPRHQTWAEKYAWFRTPRRAARFVVGTDWDSGEVEQFVIWAAYTFSDEDIQALADILTTADPSAQTTFERFDRRLAAAWILAKRLGDTMSPDLRADVTALVRAKIDSKVGALVAEDLGLDVDDLFDLTTFHPDLLAFPERVRADAQLFEEAVEYALTDHRVVPERFWDLGDEFIDEVARRASEVDGPPSRFLVDTIGRSNLPDRFERLFAHYRKLTDSWDRERIGETLASQPDELASTALGLLQTDSPRERRIGLHFLRILETIPGEFEDDVRRVRAETDDLRVKVELTALVEPAAA